ncbi:MAG: class I SAM-dependent methyltransferase, partial [Chloroflexi bacterium]|nr:class I SAM-dependent methyltransferase [Chloroflexota bacterium]
MVDQTPADARQSGMASQGTGSAPVGGGFVPWLPTGAPGTGIPASLPDNDLLDPPVRPLVEALKLLSQAHPRARALDLGCGRGEWLHFLGQHGLLAWGVDQNAVMLSEAKARGCEVSAMDLITALKAQPDQSLLLVSAFHVAEHLPFEVLY